MDRRVFALVVALVVAPAVPLVGDDPPVPQLPAPVAVPVLTLPDRVDVMPGDVYAVTATISNRGHVAFFSPDGLERWTLVEEIFGMKARPTVFPGRAPLVPGEYRLYAYAGNADGLTAPKLCRVVVKGTPPKEPPGKEPPTPPAPGFYFMVIRPDGPAAPAFTALMANPGWDALRAKGHRVKDFTLTEAAGLGVRLPDAGPVPCVVTLRPAADGRSSVVARGPVPLPPDAAQIGALPDGVK